MQRLPKLITDIPDQTWADLLEDDAHIHQFRQGPVLQGSRLKINNFATKTVAMRGWGTKGLATDCNVQALGGGDLVVGFVIGKG